MDLIVTVRELHYAGKARFRGERFQASEGDGKLLKLLKKAEDPPAQGPVGQVATTAAPVIETPAPVVAEAAESAAAEPVEPAAEPEPAADPEPEPEPDSASDPSADAETKTPPYRTRRLKAED